MANTKKDTEETKELKKKSTTTKAKGATTKTASTKTKKATSKEVTSEVKKSTPKKTSSETKKPSSKKVTPKKVNNEPKKETTKNIIEVTEVLEEPRNQNKDIDLEKTVVISKIDEERYKKEIEKLERGKDVNYRLVIYLIVFVLAIIIGGLCYLHESSKEEKEQTKTYNLDEYFDEFGNLKSNPKKEVNKEETSYQNIKEIGIEEYKTKLDNKEKMVVLVASHNCNICKIYEPVLNEALEETNVEAYKIDIAKFTTKEESETFNELFSITGTPVTFVVENGTIKDSQRGGKNKEVTLEFINNNY